MKAVIYARYSSHAQREESISDQLRVCHAYCEQNGYEVVSEYTDSAMTGTNDNRPSFQRMIADSSKRLFDVVVIYKTDRFARNRYDSVVYKKKLKDHNVTVESATEANLSGAEGELMESLLEGLASFYSKQLAENTKRGMYGNALKGKANGRVIFGYDITPDGYYSINEHEAKAIVKIFEMYASDAPLDLSKLEGYRTKNNKPLSKSFCAYAVRNVAYKGTYKWSDVVIENGMPRIVSDELWDRVQTKRVSKRRKNKYEPYMLSGKLFNIDGSRCSVDSTKKKNGYVYQYYLVGNRKRIRKELLETSVIQAVSETLSEPKIVDMITTTIIEAQKNDDYWQSEVSDIEAKIEEINKKKANLFESIATLGMRSEIVDMINDYDKQIDSLSKELESVKYDIPNIDSDLVKLWLTSISKANSQRLLDTFVSKVVVDGDIIYIYFILNDLRKRVRLESSQGYQLTSPTRFGEFFIFLS